VRRLAREDCKLVSEERDRLDLRRPAARVGGIGANATRPADFLDDNLALQTDVIHCAAEIGVSKLLFLGSAADQRIC
jgi:GDP-L-fucose synthase